MNISASHDLLVETKTTPERALNVMFMVKKVVFPPHLDDFKSLTISVYVKCSTKSNGVIRTRGPEALTLC